MNELKNTIWNRRLPSFIGIFFIVLAFGTITWLSRNAILFGTKAAVDETPKNITVSNISAASFTVSYVTDDVVTGTVNFGKEAKTNQIAFDVRDAEKGIALTHRAHYIIVKGLNPATKYFFTITSGSKNFLKDNTPYEVTTGATLTGATTGQSALAGKVILEDGNVPSEAIAYLSSDTTQTVSTLVEADGSYHIDLTTLLSKDLSSVATLTPTTVLNLQIMDPTRQSHVSLLASQANPVPVVILSKDYDFAVSDEPLAPSPVASASGTPAVFPTIEDQGSTAPQILTPKSDQTFKDQQPLFKGKATPNGDVQITIQSAQEINTTVSADANGTWQYRPTAPLAPGNHTITIRTLDANGIIKTITQSFVVYAEGSQFTQPSGSPAPSRPAVTLTPTAPPPSGGTTASPNPTAVPTGKPTATPSVKPTATITTVVSPTTIAITSSPTPTIFSSTSISPTAPPIPTTGSASLAITIISIVSVVSIGALLFFFTAL